MSISTLRWQRLLAVVVILVMIVASFSIQSNVASAKSKTSVTIQPQPAAFQGSLASLANTPIKINTNSRQIVVDPRTDFRTQYDWETDKPYVGLNTTLPLPKAKAATSGNRPQTDGGISNAPVAINRAHYTDAVAPGLYSAWEGLNQGSNRTLFTFGFLPSDSNGDTSGDVYSTGYYVETVNGTIAIWDYSQTNVYGAWPKTVYGPAPINTLWTGTGTACETTNDGDPIVLYDEVADRWLVSQFALPYLDFVVNPYPYPFYECVAISQTSDPTGAYWLYAFPFNNMPDYPKFGVWPDGYYMTINQFVPPALSWGGAGIAVFDRTAMLAGGVPTWFFFDAGLECANDGYIGDWCGLGGMLPGDADGAFPAPATPNYVVQVDDDAWSVPGVWPVLSDQLELWSVVPNWIGSTATMSYDYTLPVAAFDSDMCGYARSCITQPGTAQGLDAIADRLMHRLQFRDFGTYQAMVTNHTVDANGANKAGVRWYELRNTGAGWSVYQQATFAPDSDSRWMGSIAMDAVGNLALGYTVSGSTVYPSIRYTVHLASDPLNSMRTEQSIATGAGSQTSSAARWGDYSSMSVSPDGCDFVYVNQYLRGTTPAEWYTRMGNFGLDSCWDVDTTSPDTFISSTGTAGPGSTTAEFTFYGDDGGGAGVNIAGFECSLDGSTFATCTSPKSYTGLANGAHTFQVHAIDSSGNIDWTPATYTWTIGIFTSSFTSQGANDGFVIETTEVSGLGGTTNAVTTVLYVGDYAADRQVKGFLSFDTSALPDTAVVLGATLQMRYHSATGTNPYTTHGPLLVDINDPFFGAGANLLASDFQAAASATNVATCGAVPVASWYSCNLTSGFGFFNQLGTTQFRLGFTLDDNDDGGIDLVRFYSGNYFNASYRPVLVVTYYVP